MDSSNSFNENEDPATMRHSKKIQDGEGKQEANPLLLTTGQEHQKSSSLHDDDDSNQRNNETEATAHSDRNTRLIARRWLALSHFGNQFSELAWQFAIVIFFTQVTDYQSLLLVSTYGVTLQFLVACGTPIVGRWIDDMTHNHGKRITVANQLIGLENVTVILATLICYRVGRALGMGQSYDNVPHVDAESQNSTASAKGILWTTETSDDNTTGTVIWVEIILIHILGGMAQVLDRSFLVAVERDWVVLLSHDMGDYFLSSLNVTLKQIDLSCQVFAPTITGWILLLAGPHGILWIGGLNCLALIVEWTAMTKIHDMLTISTASSLSSGGDNDVDPNSIHNETGDETAATRSSAREATTPVSRQYTNALSVFATSLHIYFQQQPIAWGGVALALLYFNLLTFSGMMTAYLVSQGMSLTTIGMWRGVSSLVGLVATCIYHQSEKHCSLSFTAMWSIAWEFLCLTATFASIFCKTKLSLILLIGGVLPSRIGLWVFDIAITQLYQQSVPVPVRGQVGGVQMSLNALFELLPFVLAMVFHKPEQFSVLIVGGYMAVLLAMLLYLFGFYIPTTRGKHGHRSRFQIVATADSSSDVELTFDSV